MKIGKGHMPYNKEAILWLEETEPVLKEEARLQEEAWDSARIIKNPDIQPVEVFSEEEAEVFSVVEEAEVFTTPSP
jgi:hypothetical protein